MHLLLPVPEDTLEVLLHQLMEEGVVPQSGADPMSCFVDKRFK